MNNGFITAFRGGQTLGFMLVGLGVLNIMILIMIFKAAWYNQYIAEIIAAGRPYDMCPKNHAKGIAGANDYLYKKQWYVKYATAAYDKFYTDYVALYDGVDGVCHGAPALADVKAKLATYMKTMPDCKASLADWNASC